jgi:hypothetical protein
MYPQIAQIDTDLTAGAGLSSDLLSRTAHSRNAISAMLCHAQQSSDVNRNSG